MGEFVCEGFEFFGNFDSANIAKVEFVPPNENTVASTANSARQKHVEQPDIEFNIWTKPDCCGTEFENAYRTWFHFGMKANTPSSVLVKINMVDINKQQKMYGQGMCPVYKVIPGKANWERIHDKPIYNNDDRSLSFKYKTPENPESITYFAFTYPFSYNDIQNSLRTIDAKYLSASGHNDDIYYYRECLCYSLEGRKVDLLTITSYYNISKERETRLKHLFPETHLVRPFKFTGKPIIFISARVHPGETPASFTFNGFLGLLLSREDPVAVTLRRCYVFKLIPCLNPDGVARGHYRTDTRGVNLNRMYLNCSMEFSPSIYAARALIRYYHYGVEKDDATLRACMCQAGGNREMGKSSSQASLSEGEVEDAGSRKFFCCDAIKNCCTKCGTPLDNTSMAMGDSIEQGDQNANVSGLFLYIDMHGHASKKGIFMYGNHFESIDKKVECMLLPKLMSINNYNFHFTACNFTERNMYIKDKFDGLSKEGSGRVAVYKLTGLVKSYTLECNYNTGRLVNVLPAMIRENPKAHGFVNAPPKYTPHIFEEVGRALGTSILDLTGQNPMTRLPNSEFRSIMGLQEWLYLHCAGELGDPRAVSRWRVRQMTSLHSQARNNIRVFKARPNNPKATIKRIVSKKPLRPTSVPPNRKENVDTNEPSSSSTSILKSKNRNKLLNTVVRTKLFRKDSKSAPSTSSIAAQTVAKVARNHIARNMENTKCLLKNRLRLDSAPKTDESSRTSPDRIKLHEIHFIKDEEGKKMIAKYKPAEEQQPMMNDSLVVAWEANSNQPHVFSQKSTNLKILPPLPEPGTTAKKGTFRVHNFSRVIATKKKNMFKNASDVNIRRDKVKKRKSKTSMG
ncbi:cytosolic carboxypeptidase-like protein 5 [Agrilus planipennis]|uniref:tubulin-glutamate carboxypeptidase n=1 Tax=Agrilus planipennis TaxID=224129 RepID=A0A1W4X7M2_AGRPL|nr:cytosolic carboxypeptidase-like protein 5 [Agrilus planipennis]